VYASTYNELVQCLRARVPAVNLVLESERIIDLMLPMGLVQWGASPIDFIGAAHAPTTKSEPVLVINMDLTGISLAPKSDKCLSASVIKEASWYIGVTKQAAPFQAVGHLGTLVSRLKEASIGSTMVMLVLRDTSLKDDLRLCRALLQHCSQEIPATVLLVTADPIDNQFLRACMPVVSAGHPSVLELSRTINDRLAQTMSAAGSTEMELVDNDEGSSRCMPLAEASAECGKALAGLHVQLALNLLMMHIEAGMRHTRRTEGRLLIDLGALSNDKAALLNKAGYMSLIKDLPDESRIGGLDRLKAWLRFRAAGFSEHARSTKLAPPKGVLLVGPPGTAKSMCAKMAAKMFGVPLIRLDIGSLFNSLLGSSERNMKNALSVAEASAPCVLMLDELDKSMSGIGSNSKTDGGTSDRLRGTLLTWMADKKSDVFVIATANSILELPPEMTRLGRWDAVVFVDLPNFVERKVIWTIHLDLVEQTANVGDLDVLADKSNGYSGAEIEAVVQEAMYTAYRPGESLVLTQSMLLDALNETVPLSQARAADLKYLRDWAAANAKHASSPDTEHRNTEQPKLGFGVNV